jgi:hypothetical protein
MFNRVHCYHRIKGGKNMGKPIGREKGKKLLHIGRVISNMEAVIRFIATL